MKELQVQEIEDVVKPGGVGAYIRVPEAWIGKKVKVSHVASESQIKVSESEIMTTANDQLVVDADEMNSHKDKLLLRRIDVHQSKIEQLQEFRKGVSLVVESNRDTPSMEQKLSNKRIIN